MKKILTIICIAIASALQAQNKKEQIQILTARVDSCMRILRVRDSIINIKLYEIEEENKNVQIARNMAKSCNEDLRETKANLSKANDSIKKLNNRLNPIPTFIVESGIYEFDNGKIELTSLTNGTMFLSYDSYCTKDGYEFGSSGRGIFKFNVDYGCYLSDILFDESSETYVRISLFSNEQGHWIRFYLINKTDINKAFCWEYNASYRLTKQC